jgi:hypothetical protein
VPHGPAKTDCTHTKRVSSFSHSSFEFDSSFVLRHFPPLLYMMRAKTPTRKNSRLPRSHRAPHTSQAILELFAVHQQTRTRCRRRDPRPNEHRFRDPTVRPPSFSAAGRPQKRRPLPSPLQNPLAVPAPRLSSTNHLITPAREYPSPPIPIETLLLDIFPRQPQHRPRISPMHHVHIPR